MLDVLPAAAQHFDEFEKYLRVGEIRGPEKLGSHGLNDIRNEGFCALRLSVVSRPPLAAQCSYSNVFITYHFQPRAEWFSLLEGLLFQSVPRNILLQLEKELELEEADSWAFRLL